MKKSLVLAMAMALGVTASAYAANPFSDVPAGHWAYDNISKLAAAGVIEGYSDDTFRGDRLMTRYEMAQIVAKAMAKGANVDRLAAEFADELDALGVRVAALEKKADNVKIAGQIRYSYKSFKKENAKTDVKDSNAKLRTRLIFTGKVNDNWNFVNRLENNQTFHGEKETSDYKGDDEVSVNRAFLSGRLGGAKVDAGRAGLYLAEGMIYDNTFDGVSVKYGDKVMLGGYYGKLTEAKYNAKGANKVDAWGVNGKAALGEKVDVFAGYDALSPDMDGVEDVNLTNAGLKFKVNDDIALTGMWLHSDEGTHKDGANAILDLFGASYKEPGSFGFQAVYYNQPSYSAESHTMNGDYDLQNLWRDGFKGYSVAASYTVAKNMMASVKYYDLKSKENSDTKNKTLWSELQLRF